MNNKQHKLPPLILLPGLGADERMFEAQRGLPCEIIVPTIPISDKDEDMHRYSQRIVNELDIQQPFFLGGTSFGGSEYL